MIAADREAARVRRNSTMNPFHVAFHLLTWSRDLSVLAPVIGLASIMLENNRAAGRRPARFRSEDPCRSVPMELTLIDIGQGVSYEYDEGSLRHGVIS